MTDREIAERIEAARTQRDKDDFLSAVAGGERDKGANPYVATKPLQVSAPQVSLRGEHSVDELLDMQFDDRPLSFLGREDVIFRGNSILLAAKEKVGKSSLVRHLGQNWAMEGHSILYISEEWARVWHRQLEVLGFQKNAGHFQVVEGMGHTAFQLRIRAERGPEDIVIVDTLTWLFGVNLSNRDEVVKELRQWTALCRDGKKTLILLAHLNKRGEIAGSHAFGAGVDTVITYREAEGWNDLRTVEIRSRMVAEPLKPFAIRKVGSVFTIEDVPNELTLSLDQTQVLEVLHTDPSEAMTVQDVTDATGFKESKTRTLLHRLVALELVRDVTGNLGAAGGRGNAAKYVAVVQDNPQ